jgi:hypothetical protein
MTDKEMMVLDQEPLGGVALCGPLPPGKYVHARPGDQSQ